MTVPPCTWKLRVFFCFYSSSKTIQACDLSILADTSRDATLLEVGTDGPADPATIGYNLNHFAIIAKDIKATMKFYGEIFGLRHIFTFHATDKYDIAYMGYPNADNNGTTFQTGQQLLDQKQTVQGLLEFLCPRDETEVLTASTAVPNTFSHIGFIVPDISKAQHRMETYGVKIIKPVGVKATPNSPVANAFGVGAARVEVQQAILDGAELIGFDRVLLVEDPDGNLIEIQQ